MTIDEALAELDVWTGVDDREKRREVLAALVAAATERGRAEERKHLHDWAMERDAMAMRDDDPVSAGVWEAVAYLLRVNDDGDLAECCALEDLLAAHGREAAAAELERAAKCSCARLDGEGVVSVSFLRCRAAALRGKEGTE